MLTCPLCGKGNVDLFKEQAKCVSCNHSSPAERFPIRQPTSKIIFNRSKSGLIMQRIENFLDK
jgi:hypothetical protein